MLALPLIDQLVYEAASAVYGEGAISRVSSKLVADSYGDDMLSVSVVFTGARFDDFVGDKALEASASIRRTLQDYGEERFALVNYDAEGGWKRKRRKRRVAATNPSRPSKADRGKPAAS